MKLGDSAHASTHTGEKLNKCEQCNYSSREAGNLKTHTMRAKSGEKRLRIVMWVYTVVGAFAGPVPVQEQFVRRTPSQL